MLCFQMFPFGIFKVLLCYIILRDVSTDTFHLSTYNTEIQTQIRTQAYAWVSTRTRFLALPTEEETNSQDATGD